MLVFFSESLHSRRCIANGRWSEHRWRFDRHRPPSLDPLRDAAFSKHDSGCDASTQDCLRGLASAASNGRYRQNTFDFASYELLDDPIHGDIPHNGSHLPRIRRAQGAAVRRQSTPATPPARRDRLRRRGEIAFAGAERSPSLARRDRLRLRGEIATNASSACVPILQAPGVLRLVRPNEPDTYDQCTPQPPRAVP